MPGLRLHIEKTDRGRELEVHYENTALRAMGIEATVRAKCMVGSDVVTDVELALMPMTEVVPGSHVVTQLGQFDVRLFAGGVAGTFDEEKPVLAATPSVCEVWIMTRLDAKSDMLVEACARLDHPPAPGLCPPGTFPTSTSR